MSKPFEDRATQIAYNSIHDFFDVCHLSHAIKYTDCILTAAVDYKIWKQESPSSLLFYMENFRSLYSAAYSIYYTYSKREQAMIPLSKDGLPDISILEHFMDMTKYANSTWSNFPRYLTKAQYHDPYKAINKFCKYMAEAEWNNYIKDVTEFALSKNTIEEVTHPYNILTVRIRIMQLIEACHLVHIRTNKKS